MFKPSSILFLGAGASRPAGIPTMEDFVSKFVTDITGRDDYWNPLKAELELLLKLCRDVTSNREPSRKSGYYSGIVDLELLYEIVRRINRSNLADGQLSWSADSTQVIAMLPKTRATELIEFELIKFIQRTCTIFESARVKYLKPFLRI
ncbi:hypothetical protein KKC97_11895, partial [bacterium]|nr:hypothetical protein [bacterium]MBU1638356.1 hypothetical protein [bacterium]